MEVHLRVPAALREPAGGRATFALDLGGRATVADLLDAIGTAHPALERRVRDEQGALRTHVNLFIGDENVRALDGLDTELGNGDEVSILAAISGG